MYAVVCSNIVKESISFEKKDLEITISPDNWKTNKRLKIHKKKSYFCGLCEIVIRSSKFPFTKVVTKMKIQIKSSVMK